MSVTWPGYLCYLQYTGCLASSPARPTTKEPVPVPRGRLFWFMPDVWNYDGLVRDRSPVAKRPCQDRASGGSLLSERESHAALGKQPGLIRYHDSTLSKGTGAALAKFDSAFQIQAKIG